MQVLSNIVPIFKSELSNLYDDREIVSIAYISIEYVFGFNRSECIINSSKTLENDSLNKIYFIVNELKQKKPIQYILGETEFYGLKFKLNKSTLIPRPETEELVEWVLKDSFDSAIDICSGSGCISIALAKATNSKVSAIDISNDAINIAKENATLNNVRVDFYCNDIFAINNLQKSDVIVSNPPYVLESEKIYINTNVLNFEPHIALFVEDNNPLVFYNKIAKLATQSLNIGGVLFFEINPLLSKEIKILLCGLGFVDIELKKDINDKIRMVKAIWK